MSISIRFDILIDNLLFENYLNFEWKLLLLILLDRTSYLHLLSKKKISQNCSKQTVMEGLQYTFFLIVTHFIVTYHISLVNVQNNYCNNNLLILDVKQLNKIVKLY